MQFLKLPVKLGIIVLLLSDKRIRLGYAFRGMADFVAGVNGKFGSPPAG